MIEQTMSAALGRRDIPLSFHENWEDVYVPLEAESRVHSALQESEWGSPTVRVILLYGGAGRGKSTVARQICLTYGESKSGDGKEKGGSRSTKNDKEGKVLTKQERDEGEQKEERAGDEDKLMFSHLVTLQCGREMDAHAKEMELLQKLGWNDFHDIGVLGSDQSRQKASLQSLLKEEKQHVLQARLQGLLKDQRLLIVLDDIWHCDFLQSLLNLSGSNVKYLITSQQEDICKDLTCKFKSIKIDELQDNDSKAVPRKILASHVGFSTKIIPDHLKDMADRILDKAEGIPLVIATLGAQIGSTDKNDLAVWRHVLGNFLLYVNHHKPPMFTEGIQYPRSYWSAIKQSIDQLDQDEKNLLLLLGMCKGPSIPEHILEVFYNFVFSEAVYDATHFSQWKMQLKHRQLLSEVGQKLLSVHDMTKKLIAEQMKEAIESIARLLRESKSVMHPTALSSEKTRVVRVLVCLYLDTKFAQPVASQMDLTLGTFSETRRRAIEPITELMVLLDVNSGKSVKRLHMSAKQVFLKFICNSALDHHHISQLLGCTNGVMKTLQFLENVSLLEESFWQKNTVRRIPFAVLKIFQNTSHRNFQVKAAVTLAALCFCNNQTRDDIVHTPGMLHQLVQSLYRGRDPDLQSSAALLVSSAASLSGTNTLLKIMDFPNMVHVLAESLIVNHQNLTLQANVAAALGNLTSRDSAIRDKIACFPNLLESLVVSLNKGWNPALQRNAAWALTNLGLWDQSIKEEIFRHSGLLDNLVKYVDQNQSSGLSEHAASLIAVLAATEDATFKSKIACLPNLLEILGLSLWMGQNPVLKRIAARAVAHLSDGNQSVKGKICDVPGLLDNLVKAVAQDQDSDLAEQAARAITNLSTGEDSTFHGRIATVPNLLETLAVSLRKGQNLVLQKYAASAFVKLGSRHQVIKQKILNLSELLDTLGSWVDADQNFALADHESGPVRMANNTIRDEIQIFFQSYEFYRLMRFLIHEGNRELQVVVARLFANLTCAKDDAIGSRLLHFCGGKLASSFVQWEDRELQMEAARIFSNLTYMKDSPLRHGILQVPGLLKALAMSSIDDQTENLQPQETIDIRASASIDKQKIVANIFGDNISNLQVEAARVLINWAVSEEDSFKGEIFRSPGMLVWAKLESMTPHSKPGSERELRSDIRLLGLATWEEEFDPQQMCALYDVRTGQNGVDFMFFHAKAMANLFGVGIQHGIVSVSRHPELQIVIREIGYEQWRDEWLDSHTGSFKPMIFQKLHESSSSAGYHDDFDRLGSLDFSTLLSTKHGNVGSSFGSRLLYKRWMENFVQFLQHGSGTGNAMHDADKNEGKSSRKCRQQGGNRHDESGSSGNDGSADANKSSMDQSSGRVVVEVQLQRNSVFYETREADLKIDVKDKAADEGLSLIRKTSAIVPNLTIEFLWESEFERRVIVDVEVEYSISKTLPTANFRWHQNDLQVSLSCMENEENQVFRKIDDRVISETRDVPLQVTERSKQTTSSSRNRWTFACLEPRSMEFQHGMRNTSGRKAEKIVEDAWLGYYQCLATTPTFAVTCTNKRNDLSYNASRLFSIEPALHQEDTKKAAISTGLHANLTLSVGGTWVLITEHDDQLLRFNFEATKKLSKSTNPTESSDEKQLKSNRPSLRRKLASLVAKRSTSSVQVQPAKAELKEVWQGVTQEVILDPNFEKFFG